MDKQTPTPEQLMIEDLTSRVARANLEAAEWKARAMLAEHALKEIKDAEADKALAETVRKIEEDA